MQTSVIVATLLEDSDSEYGRTEIILKSLTTGILLKYHILAVRAGEELDTSFIEIHVIYIP